MPFWHNNISPDENFFPDRKNEWYFITSGMSDSEIYVHCIGNEMYPYFQDILIVTNTKQSFMAFNQLKGEKGKLFVEYLQITSKALVKWVISIFSLSVKVLKLMVFGSLTVVNKDILTCCWKYIFSLTRLIFLS